MRARARWPCPATIIPWMDELFPSEHWFRTEGPDKTIHSTKDSRREVLWTNYEPD